MEGLRHEESKESFEVRGLIQSLYAHAPDEPAMNLLTTELNKALGAARTKNDRLVEQAIQKSFEFYNALAAKQFDVLSQFEHVVQKIRTLAQRVH